IPDVEGRAMYTEQRLFSYLQQFERDFATSRAKVIDASEGGALKRGATVMTLVEAVKQMSGTAGPTSAFVGPAVPDILPVTTALENRLDESHQIEKIATETLPLLED